MYAFSKEAENDIKKILELSVMDFGLDATESYFNSLKKHGCKLYINV